MKNTAHTPIGAGLTSVEHPSFLKRINDRQSPEVETLCPDQEEQTRVVVGIRL